jgi:hypothetical protein
MVMVGDMLRFVLQKIILAKCGWCLGGEDRFKMGRIGRRVLLYPR